MLSELSFFKAVFEAHDDLRRFHFASIKIFLFNISLSPHIVIFATAGFCYILVNYVSSFTTLIHAIESISVPDAHGITSSIFIIVSKCFNKFYLSITSFPNAFGGFEDPLEGAFSFNTDIFVHYLDQKFGNKHTDSHLIRSGHIRPLSTHSVDIAVVFLS